MLTLSVILIALPFAMFVYAYFGYPLFLWLATRLVKGASAQSATQPMAGAEPARGEASEDSDWPYITITVPAYNEERRIRSTIESLLAIDYPAERRQILIASDA